MAAFLVAENGGVSRTDRQEEWIGKRCELIVWATSDRTEFVRLTKV